MVWRVRVSRCLGHHCPSTGRHPPTPLNRAEERTKRRGADKGSVGRYGAAPSSPLFNRTVEMTKRLKTAGAEHVGERFRGVVAVPFA